MLIWNVFPIYKILANTKVSSDDAIKKELRS